MTNWSHGYNLTTGYTFGFYRELAPDWIDLGLSLRGLEPPRPAATTPFRYLELGSGQGFGLCLLAAANPQGEFVGIDFSPEHNAHARSLAATMGLHNIRFDEGDFAALGDAWPADYGEFDYVVMHGIYSWVPKGIRESLIAILTAAVRSGGVVYVSYNAMPGWVSTLPFQHILRLLESSGATKGIAAIEVGRELFGKLEQADSGVTRALPGLKARIEGTRKQPENYLVQEYLHENWHPLWCSQVMAELAGAKLDLAGSATMAEQLLPQILPQSHRDVLAGQQHPMLREDLIDCLINQTFRRDIYVRGQRRRLPADASWQESFRFWRLNPALVPDEILVATSFGNLKLDGKAVAPIIEAIGEASLSLAEIVRLPSVRANPRALNQQLVLLIQSGWLACGRRDHAEGESARSANAAVARLAAVGAPYRHIAAPALGSAVPAGDSELILLHAYLAGTETFAAQGAALLKEGLGRLGRKLAKDGKALEGAEEMAELERVTQQFTSQTVPHWRRLGAIA